MPGVAEESRGTGTGGQHGLIARLVGRCVSAKLYSRLSPHYFALSTWYSSFHVLPASSDQANIPPPTGSRNIISRLESNIRIHSLSRLLSANRNSELPS